MNSRISEMLIIGTSRMKRNSSVQNRPKEPSKVAQSQKVP